MALGLLSSFSQAYGRPTTASAAHLSHDNRDSARQYKAPSFGGDPALFNLLIAAHTLAMALTPPRSPLQDSLSLDVSHGPLCDNHP
ncbi:hypothetical protein BOTBODRAFT_526320 [Botryobasidium botryosum FD-172 SS1]|uniref:Uncharacterized protein n=1 Tax=Botryobasidium botryosum (strain FD-172 SS1) TaxID=930990 RepID=A0A067M103_BOTB1|nr:hypothetical protein BOTBODRAFT_526320 [Botryobasidium botryosum FD-172 SS1]